MLINTESRAYFRVIGARIRRLRESREFTQAELARAIGVSQQAVFAYELGDRRVTLLLATKIGRALTISVEDLIGVDRPIRMPRSRLSPRAMRHAERLQGLSKTDRRFVVRMIDTLEQARKSYRQFENHE